MLLNLYDADVFCSENVFCFFMPTIQVHLRLHYIMEANTMNPDQTAALGAV